MANRIERLIVSVIVSFAMVTAIILLWPSLNAMVTGMNVGLFMFLNQGFWQFLGTFLVLSIAITLTVRVLIGRRFKRG